MKIGVAIPSYIGHIVPLFKLLDSIQNQTVIPDKVVVSCSSTKKSDFELDCYFEKCIFKANKKSDTVKVENDTTSEGYVSVNVPIDVPTIPDEEDLENTFIEDNIDPSDTIVLEPTVVEDDLEKTEEQYGIEEEEDIKILPMEEIDGMQEIDFNLEELAETDQIHIKKRNDVYYEMYREARRKAKIARDLALSSYLEVKRIKNTYMLDDIRDSDDSDLEFEEEDDENGENDNENKFEEE